MKDNNSIFETLSKINVNDKTEKKKTLTYLSWTFAWSEVKKAFPDATYNVWKDEDGNPFTFNKTLGYMCYTTVCIGGETLEMWLPVMNGANKAMLDNKYSYKTRFGDKEVEAATMFDINKTIMRCLVKNIAMFGLGLYIFSGEDLPESEEVVPAKPVKFVPNPKISLEDAKNEAELKAAYKSLTKEQQVEFKALKDALKLKLK